MSWFWKRSAPAVEVKAGELTDPNSLSWEALVGALGATAAGISVTPTTAMRCATVRACVLAIAEPFGQLPVKLYRRLADGGKEVDNDHPTGRLLTTAATPWISAARFRESLTIDALLYGRGVAVLNRVDGRVVELNRLEPATVSVERDRLTGEPSYRSGTTLYGHEDVLILECPTGTGLDGESPVHAGRDAIAMAMLLERFGAKLFANGARPSGVLAIEGKLTKESAALIGESWRAAHTGDGVGRTAVVDSGARYSPLQFTSVDSQYHEQRVLAVQEIARLFRVPLPLVGEYSRQTWSNAAEGGAIFLRFTLAPWIERWRAAYAKALLTDEERADYDIDFVTGGLLAADISSRGTAYAALIGAMVMTPNEARALENLPHHPDGDRLANPATTSGAPTQQVTT